MELELQSILSNFKLDGRVISCEPYGEGHINETKLVVSSTGKRYILQKISDAAFPDIEGLMSNITRVCKHIEKKTTDPRASMHIVATKDGDSWIRANSGAWRVYDFVENTVCLQSAANIADFVQSAIGFGKFQNYLSDFPADTLNETIKNFHNTKDRYRIFDEILAKNSMGRADAVQREIDFVLEKRQEMGTLQSMRETGFLPVRVTHNDTKLNNVLLDEKTHEAVCVIDLDTVMPGLAAYDFGDSIRFGAATAAEDEKDLDKMTIDLGRYEAFANAFVNECKALTKDEILSFPLGAKIMTMECGVRFLYDYLDGDRYFGIHYPTHNLDRARTQFKLVSEMDKNWDKMRMIIEKSAK